MEPTVCSIRYLFVIALEIACIQGSSLKLSLGFIDLSPAEVIAQKNQPLLLNCSGYSEAGPLRTRWRHQGILVEDDHRQVLANGSLYIEKIIYQKKGRKDEGNYTCLLENKIGVLVSRPIRVSLARISRTFTVEPQPFTSFDGGNARFSCQIHSVPPAVILWFHNGHRLPHNDSRFTMLPSGVLQITDLSMADAGNYHCECRNFAKQRTSIAAYLTVQPRIEAFRSPVFLSTSEPVLAVANSSAVLECLVNSIPSSEISWEREDGNIIDTELAMEPGKSNLYLLNAQPEDSGVYICIAKSVNPDTGQVIIEHQKVPLTVLVPPHFVSVPESHIKPPAQTSRFECFVEGNPSPSVEWLKNGEPLYINGRIKLKVGNVLVISQTVSTDSGIYQCVASNSVGVRTVAARLQITASIDQPKPPEGLKARTMSSTSIQLSWDPAVSPNELAIQAYTVHYLPTSGGLELQTVAVNTSQLIVKLKPYTNYTFYVRAYNGKSASEQSEAVTQMTGEDVPVSAPTVSLTSRSPTTLHVQWNELSPEKARGIIVGHRIHYRKHRQASYSVIDVPASVREYTITGLQPKKMYDIRVMSGTKAGFPVLIDEDWPWTVYEMPEAATAKVPLPPIMHLTVINTSALEVEWSMPVDNIYPVESFHLSYRQQSHPLKGPIIIPANVTKFLLSNLAPHTWYEVHLVANNGEGESRESVRNIITFSGDNPDIETVEVVEPPHHLEAEPTSSTAIHLTWKTPETSKNISYYTVRYHPVLANGLVNESLIQYIRSTNREVVITDLKPFTLYVFSVRSHDVHNQQGPFSQKVECRTMEDIPTPPQDLTWTRVDANSVRINWQSPRHTNGLIIAYHILYNINIDDADLSTWYSKVEGASEMSSLLNGLASNTVYYLCMKAENKAGLSPRTQILQMKLAMRQNSSKSPNQEVFDDQHDPLLGIIVGISIGGCCVIICAIVIIYRNRCCPVAAPGPATPNGHYSMCCTYGYIPQTNGHVGGTVTSRNKRSLHPEVQELDCFTPMLNHMPNGRTDHHLDTKGGYPTNTCNGGVNSYMYHDTNNRHHSTENHEHSTENMQASESEAALGFKPRVRYRSADSLSNHNADGDSSTVLLIDSTVHDEHSNNRVQTDCSGANVSARSQESSCNTKSSDSICSLVSTSNTCYTSSCIVPDLASSVTAAVAEPPHRPSHAPSSNFTMEKEQNCMPSTTCLGPQEKKTLHKEERTVSSDDDEDDRSCASLPYSVNAFLSPLITPRFSQTTSLHSSTEFT